MSVLTHVRPGVGPSIGVRVEPLPAEEVVLDELQVGAEAEPLMVDVPLPRVGADHQAGDTEAVAEPVDHRRLDVAIEASPVIPGQEDGRALPGLAADARVDDP